MSYNTGGPAAPQTPRITPNPPAGQNGTGIRINDFAHMKASAIKPRFGAKSRVFGVKPCPNWDD